MVGPRVTRDTANTAQVHALVLCTHMYCARTCIGHAHVLCTHLYWARTCIVHALVLCTHMYCARTCIVHPHVLCTHMYSLLSLVYNYSPSFIRVQKCNKYDYYNALLNCEVTNWELSNGFNDSYIYNKMNE